MFEQTMEEMVSHVYVHPDTLSAMTASLISKVVDRGDLVAGWNRLTFKQALRLVSKIDSSMRDCPLHFADKIRAQRNSIVFSFGPEFEESVGPCPERKVRWYE